MTYLDELINQLVWGFADLGICKPETKHFGRHLFRDFCPEKLLKHAGFDLPLELFEPEIEFPLSIFTLKECESNSLRERS